MLYESLLHLSLNLIYLQYVPNLHSLIVLTVVFFFLSLWIELLDAWRTSVVVVNGTHFVWSRSKTRKTILKYLKVGWSTKLKQGFTICKNTIHFQLRPFMHLAGNEFFNIIWIRTSNITKRENFVAIKLSKTTHLERNLYYLQQIN